MKKIFAFGIICCFLLSLAVHAAGPAGSKGALQTSNGDGTFGSAAPGTAAASNARGLPANSWSGLNILGDAYSYNSSFVPQSNTYGTIVGKTAGAAPTYNVIKNFSFFTCDVVSSQLVPNIFPAAFNNSAVLWLPNPSDVTYGGGSFQNHLIDTQSCVLGGLTWAAIPTPRKIFAQSGCTTTGPWGNTGDPVNNNWPSYLGITTSSNGATASCPITTQGNPVYIWYQMVANNGGAFTYNIDGGSNTTVTTQGQNSFTFPNSANSNYTSGTPTTLGGIRIPSVSPGSHTINFAITSTTSVSNTVTIEGLATPANGPLHGSAPAVFLGGQLNSSTSFLTAISAFNSAWKSLTTTLASDGLSVGFADVQAKVLATPSTDYTFSNLLTASGQKHIAEAFLAIMQANRPAANVISPLDTGGACNGMLLNDEYVNGSNYDINTTANSAVVTVNNYKFNPATATRNGGGDVGKRFCVGVTGHADNGPCTYILSASTTSGGSSATLGANMNATGGAYGVMGGYPANPNDPSTAQDDSAFITLALQGSRLIGGKVLLPTNCMVHNMQDIPFSWLDGNNAGLNYGGNFDLVNGIGPEPTVLYNGITGTPSDTQVGININNAQNARLSNFMIAGVVFPTTNSPLAGAAIGYTVSQGLGPDFPVWTDHLSFFQNTVDVGEAFGWNQEVDFTASATGKVLTVSAITSNNFTSAYKWAYSGDYLALGRTITGVGIPSGETITSVAPNGQAGTYGLSLTVSTTVSSESMKSVAAAGGMRLMDVYSQHFITAIGYNGDMSDSEIDYSYCTGTFMRICWYLGPNTAGFANGSNRWVGGRGEEQGVADIVCDGCNVWTGSREYQFNQGFNIINKGGEVHVQGGYMYAGGHCNTPDQDKAMVQLAGSNPITTLDGVALEPLDFGSGCTQAGNQYLFSTSTGGTYTGGLTTVHGGSAIGLTQLYNWTNGTFTHYVQDVDGWPKLNTSIIPTVSGLSLVTTSQQGGIDSGSVLSGVTSSVGVLIISGLPPAPNSWNCEGGDQTIGTIAAQVLAGTTSSSCALQLSTTTGGKVWYSGQPH